MQSVRARNVSLRLPLRSAELEPTAGKRRLRVEWLAVLLALAVALAPLPIAARVGGALLVALTAVLALRARRVPAPAGWVTSGAAGLVRERGGRLVRLAEWGSRFGVVALANESRDRGLLAFTTPHETRVVPIRPSGDDDAIAALELFSRAPALPDAELASAPEAEGDALSASDAQRVLADIRAHDPGAVDRILLSDPRGAAIVLEGTELRAGDRVIDLTAPLEWRGFLFHESAGPLAAVVQATWVRQAGIEVVLVAPMPTDATARATSVRTRDVRLNAAAPDAPPPLELRMAIERLFMAPLRHALERAPRASRAPAVVSRANGDERDERADRRA